MRGRTPALLTACLVAAVVSPAVSRASETLEPRSATVDGDGAAQLMARGIDITESGFRPGDGEQKVQFAATDSLVEKIESDGIAVDDLPIDKAPPKSAAKSAVADESPNPFFNVYRSYMEPGGIADEMKAIAAANPDVMKLEQIGTSTLRKPIYALKMTANARATPDGSRDAILFSAINHAREWIAAETGRRLPGWFAAHKNDPKIKELIQTRELWFLPIQNPDGYDFTFTCGTGTAQVSCDYRTTSPNNRFWRKTLRDNNANGIYGDSQDG